MFLAQRPSRDLTINTPAMAAATSGVRTQDHTRSWATGGKLSSSSWGVCTGTSFPSKWSNEEGAAHCLSPPVSAPHPHPLPLPTARPQVLRPAQEGVTQEGGKPRRPTTGPSRRPACLLGSLPGVTVFGSVSPSPPQSLGLQALQWLSLCPALDLLSCQGRRGCAWTPLSWERPHPFP